MLRRLQEPPFLTSRGVIGHREEQLEMPPTLVNQGGDALGPAAAMAQPEGHLQG